jgi:hypothetical protein
MQTLTCDESQDIAYLLSKIDYWRGRIWSRNNLSHEDTKCATTAAAIGKTISYPHPATLFIYYIKTTQID